MFITEDPKVKQKTLQLLTKLTKTESIYKSKQKCQAEGLVHWDQVV